MFRVMGLLAVAVAVGASCGGSEDEGDDPAASASAAADEPTTTAAAANEPTTTAAAANEPTTTAAASSTSTSTTTPRSSVPSDEPADYTGVGPHAVGVIELALTDRGVPDRAVYVYYPTGEQSAEPWTYSSLDAFDPAIRDFLPDVIVNEFSFDGVTTAPPAAAGPFPLAVHSHGAGGFPTDSSNLMIQLASWGYVVVAPDHWERDRMAATGLRGDDLPEGRDTADVVDALALVRAEALEPSSPLAGVVDETSPAVGVGLSAGARAVTEAADGGSLSAWVGWAPVVGESPDAPGLIVAADGDIAIPLPAVSEFVEDAEPPVALAVIEGAGHATFTDSCPEIRALGGLAGLAEEIGVDPRLLELGDNGCVPGFTEATDLWPLIAHLTIAHLQTALGLDDGSSLDADWVGQLGSGHLESFRPA